MTLQQQIEALPSYASREIITVERDAVLALVSGPTTCACGDAARRAAKDWRDRNERDMVELARNMDDVGRAEVRAENRVLDYLLTLLPAPPAAGSR